MTANRNFVRFALSYLMLAHILPDFFFIVQSVKQQTELKNAESISIDRLKPTWNEMVASVSLSILN